VVDEVEQVVVRPVEVLDYEHDRMLVGEPLDEPPPRGERLDAPVAAALGVHWQPDEWAEVRLDPGVAGGVAELALDLGQLVGLEDPRLRLHDLGERPEADAVAVWQAAPVPPRDEVGQRLHVLEELVDEA
jgi:hypothetical protein